VHFLQIWIVPDRRGLRPAYGQKAVDRDAARRGFVLLGSKTGRDGSLQIHQDVEVWLALVGPDDTRELPLRRERHAWIHVARGAVTVNGTALGEGAGASVSNEQHLAFRGEEEAEVLVFDLA
jgi:redox-sensitive bicupin YhaK (pirin superfamily)